MQNNYKNFRLKFKLNLIKFYNLTVNDIMKIEILLLTHKKMYKFRHKNTLLFKAMVAIIIVIIILLLHNNLTLATLSIIFFRYSLVD